VWVWWWCRAYDVGVGGGVGVLGGFGGGFLRVGVVVGLGG